MNLKASDKKELNSFIEKTKGYFFYNELELLFLYHIQLRMSFREAIESISDY